MSSDRLLRQVSESDLPAFFEHQRDPEATQMAAFNARDHDAFMAHWARILTDATVTARTIVVGGQVAGNVVSWSAGEERLVGYWVGKAFWGKGIASRALAEFLRIDRTRPLHAWVAKHNLGSIRVLQKCGFELVREQQNPGDVAELLLVLR
jgi:RimJ/RimL family protein N-acetyltransferase